MLNLIFVTVNRNIFLIPFKKCCRLPFAYVNIYRELYELMENREELQLQQNLTERIFDEINFGRSEFIDVYHTFVSYCLDKTLECM